jgi:hypothetical protein
MNSPQKPVWKKGDVTAAVGAVSLTGILVWAIGCGGSGGGSKSSPYALSVSRVVQLQLGLQLYEGDWDEVLPTSGKWMDAVTPYVHDASLFHSPAVGQGYGYALNSQIAGHALSDFPTPETIVSIFDSTDLTRNATDPTSTMPNPARYGLKNTIGYLDGSTQDQGTNLTVAQQYALSQTRLKQTALGILIYSNDYDDFAPIKNTWMDALLPYVKNDTLFHSPAIQAVTPNLYGYALSSTVAGQNLGAIQNPATTIMTFDSTDLTRNATDPTSTLPVPPRYGTNNTISYADGHVH